MATRSLTIRTDVAAPPAFLVELAALSLVAAMALGLRLGGVDAQSLWADELFSAFHVRHGLRHLWGEGFLTESSPPLYYTLLWAWTGLFGESAAAMRELSVFLNLLTLPILYAAGRRLGGPTAGLAAAAFFAASAAQILFAHEVRPYALYVLVVAVALLGFLRLLQEERYALFVAAMAAASYTHSTALVLWPAFGICFLAALAAERRIGRGTLGLWARINLWIFVLVLPRLVVVWMQRESEGLAWIPYPTLLSVLGIVKSLLLAPGLRSVEVAALGMAVVLAALAWAVVAAYRRGDLATLTVGLAFPLAAGVLLLAVSAVRPVLLLRTALCLALPVYLLLAAAVASLGAWRRPLIAASLALLVQLGGVGAFWAEAVKEPWRELVAEAAAAAEPDDLFVFLSAEGVPAFAYYWPGRFDFARCNLLARQGPAHEHVPQLDATRACLAEIEPEEVARRLARGEAVWLVGRGPRNVAELRRLAASTLSAWEAAATITWGPEAESIRMVRLAP